VLRVVAKPCVCLPVKWQISAFDLLKSIGDGCLLDGQSAPPILGARFPQALTRLITKESIPNSIQKCDALARCLISIGQDCDFSFKRPHRRLAKWKIISVLAEHGARAEDERRKTCAGSTASAMLHSTSGSPSSADDGLRDGALTHARG
jgi:hypothetical protein